MLFGEIIVVYGENYMESLTLKGLKTILPSECIYRFCVILRIMAVVNINSIN
jgi:hypothetical protein